jgi:hypothetical protein
MSEWISVKDRLPEPIADEDGDLVAVPVIVYAPKYPEQRIGRYRPYTKSWSFLGSNSDFSDEITYWQPFPDPPEEEA